MLWRFSGNGEEHVSAKPWILVVVFRVSCFCGFSIFNSGWGWTILNRTGIKFKALSGLIIPVWRAGGSHGQKNICTTSFYMLIGPLPGPGDTALSHLPSGFLKWLLDGAAFENYLEIEAGPECRSTRNYSWILVCPYCTFAPGTALTEKLMTSCHIVMWQSEAMFKYK